MWYVQDNPVITLNGNIDIQTQTIYYMGLVTGHTM